MNLVIFILTHIIRKYNVDYNNTYGRLVDVVLKL